jgi:dCMP deaminase
MSKRSPDFVWSEIAFGSKRGINELNAIFVPAPREMSAVRFRQLVKHYLPAGNILIGTTDEKYVKGYEDQPQFRLFDVSSVDGVIEQTHTKQLRHRLYTLRYQQHELPYVIDALKLSRIVMVNGSWQLPLQTTKPYYAMVKKGIPHELVSPFVDEKQAKTYAETIEQQLEADLKKTKKSINEAELVAFAQAVARTSFDHCLQVGAVLAERRRGKYTVLIHAANTVVPWRTFALHYGSVREKLLLPAQDQSHHDTVHAEMELVVRALSRDISLEGMTMAVTALPCPNCARVLSRTGLHEVIYSIDHSEGYAVTLFDQVGIKTRRVVV